jgi:outer membrane protein OmpA-like peptidoglycan-associated protein
MSFMRVGALVGVCFVVGCGSAKVELVASAAPPPVQTAPPPVVVAAAATGDAVLEGDRIRVAKNILYEVDKDAIKPESLPLLDAVANILNTHPEITMLTVEGHTDNQGDFNHNRQLSERRANAVVRYLALKGVKQPMQAPGYGATAPVCMTEDEGCRAQNRRVEFKIKRAQ